MYRRILLLVILSASVAAQETSAPLPVEQPELLPWQVEVPSWFAACATAETALEGASEAVQRARDAFAVGPALPVEMPSVRVGASLFGDPERSQVLLVRADSGAVSIESVEAVGEMGLSFRGTYAGGGSRFQVYVDPDDTTDPSVDDRRRAAFEALSTAILGATATEEDAQEAMSECLATAGRDWRIERAARDGYALTTATRDLTARASTQSYDEARFTIGRGGDLWVSAMTVDERHFLIVNPVTELTGWVPADGAHEASRVRTLLRPKMAEWDREAEERERQLFADTPDLRFVKLVAIENYSLSGFRFEFYNLRAGKTIKYLHVTVRPYDRVGEGISRGAGGGTKTVRLTGPSEPSISTVYTGEFDSLWLSEMVECVRVTAVRAEYMDGSERSWRQSVDSLFEEPMYWNRCPGSR